MKKRNYPWSLLLLLLFAGCWAPKSILTTANITQPVLVGGVRTIGGQNEVNVSLQEGVKFSAAIENSIYFWSAIYSYGSVTTNEGSNVIDEQILPMIDTSSDPTSILVVDQIRYDVKSGYWLLALYSGNKGWLDGAKYLTKNADK